MYQECACSDVQAVTDMEEVFLNLGLDIIGLGVFNYEFNSMTKESPVIKVRPPCPPYAGELWSPLPLLQFCSRCRHSITCLMLLQHCG